MWKGESEEVKDIYRGRAQLEKEKHKIRYPGYKYQPKKPAKRTKRNNKRRESQKRQKVEGGLPNQLQITEPFLSQVVDKKGTKISGESQVEARISRQKWVSVLIRSNYRASGIDRPRPHHRYSLLCTRFNSISWSRPR